MDEIIYWNNHETTLFAVEELKRLMQKAGNNCTIHDQTHFINSDESKEKYNRINLILTNDYNVLTYIENPLFIDGDGFVFIKSDSNVWIIGNEPRAILYAVYKYCSIRFGYQWIELVGETIVANDSGTQGIEQYTHEPMFSRRGNIIETINDPGYINSLIDWGVKNGQNEYFFTFFLWDQIKNYVTPELKKRSVHVTLGGHSLSYLIKQTNEKMLEQGKRLKFFAENPDLQDKIINEIVSIFSGNKLISRISLWPEDIGIDEKDTQGFLSTYIRFTEKLKEAFNLKKLTVEVEHIVYNAGLSWNMLEREELLDASDQVDVLYAYWGRDYSTAIDSKDERQERANRTLQDWNKQRKKQKRSLTVLEYYSDHFMLTELYPPLLKRIQQDLHDYKKMNIDGVLNLIVPSHQKGQFPEIETEYPWKWIHHLNNYIYSRIAWGEDYETIVETYFSVFKKDKAAFHKMILQLERLVSQHTKWNTSLFPARIVDPEKVDREKEYSQISVYLREIHDLVSAWDLTEAKQLLTIQTKDNFASFTSKEMSLIYFYYLREVANRYAEVWKSKSEN